MLYRKMPKTGDELSVLGFGLMRLPQKGGRIDEERTIKQIRMAIDHGINYFDTAWIYHKGESEKILGKAVNGYNRGALRLATKLPQWEVKNRNDMDKILGIQMERLQGSYIDYYLIHAISNLETWDRLKSHGVLDFLARAREDGRISNAGFSFHGPKDVFKTIIDDFDWDFCQIQYNYLDEQYQAGSEGLEYAYGKDIGVMIMEPLRGGSLVGRMPRQVEQVWKKADIKRSPAEWAFRWIYDHPQVATVLSGMNDEDHIVENLRIAEQGVPNTLTDKEHALIEDVQRLYRDLMKVGCTGCGYCMPCPKGVNVPACFEIYNRKYLFQEKMTRFEYTARLGGYLEKGNKQSQHYASQCVDCGKCARMCPQGIDIAEKLKEVARVNEGMMQKPLEWIVAAYINILGMRPE